MFKSLWNFFYFGGQRILTQIEKKYRLELINKIECVKVKIKRIRRTFFRLYLVYFVQFGIYFKIDLCSIVAVSAVYVCFFRSRTVISVIQLSSVCVYISCTVLWKYTLLSSNFGMHGNFNTMSEFSWWHLKRCIPQLQWGLAYIRMCDSFFVGSNNQNSGKLFCPNQHH